jgi:hypothetical protein
MSKLDDDLKALTQTSEMDQAVAGMVNIATLVMGHMTGMIAAGFKPVQAFQLSRDYHRIVMTKALYPDTPPAFGGND